MNRLRAALIATVVVVLVMVLGPLINSKGPAPVTVVFSTAASAFAFCLNVALIWQATDKSIDIGALESERSNLVLGLGFALIFTGYSVIAQIWDHI